MTKSVSPNMREEKKVFIGNNERMRQKTNDSSNQSENV